jgi:hypothetical protein
VQAPGGGFALAWDLTVEHLTPTAPGDARVLAVLAALERELAVLDQIGAHIAAAYLDAAITQLRCDRSRQETPPTTEFAKKNSKLRIHP